MRLGLVLTAGVVAPIAIEKVEEAMVVEGVVALVAEEDSEDIKPPFIYFRVI